MTSEQVYKENLNLLRPEYIIFRITLLS